MNSIKITGLKNLISKFLFHPCVFTLLFHSMTATSILTAQNSINIEGAGQKWVNFGDADVSGNQITVEAIVRRQNNMNIVSKHNGTTDCKYL